MDFSLAPPPQIRETWGEFIDQLKLDDPMTWYHTVADHAVVGIAGAWLSRGSIVARSWKLLPGLHPAVLTVLPFTVAVRQPGVVHVLADLAFYKGLSAYHAFQDAQRRFEEWLRRLDDVELKNSLGSAAYDVLTSGGTVTDLQVILVMPPVWLSDP